MKVIFNKQYEKAQSEMEELNKTIEKLHFIICEKEEIIRQLKNENEELKSKNNISVLEIKNLKEQNDYRTTIDEYLYGGKEEK